MSQMRSSVAIIPAYNERKHSDVVASLVHAVSRVVVVDDGSSQPLRLEGSSENATVHRFDTNRGYGDVLQWGIEYARSVGYETVVFVDGDGQHDTAYISPLLSKLASSDVVVGDRLSEHSPEVGVRQPAERYAANRLFARVLQLLRRKIELRDFFSGFIALRVSAIPPHLNLTDTRYASPAKMWPCLVGADLRIEHVPIPRIYHSTRNKFVPQYGTMKELGHHLVTEFTESCVAHLGTSRSEVLDAFRLEICAKEFAAVRAWLSPALSPNRGSIS